MQLTKIYTGEKMKAFIYKGQTYIRLIPGKRLFQSTMVHDVVNRGDIFGMNIETQVFTIIPGNAQVSHCELTVNTETVFAIPSSLQTKATFKKPEPFPTQDVLDL